MKPAPRSQGCEVRAFLSSLDTEEMWKFLDDFSISLARTEIGGLSTDKLHSKHELFKVFWNLGLVNGIDEEFGNYGN